ncbi:MAG: MarR family winged helix-turn-helix transcriptional regulator [Acetobacteraceae bacterium]
MRRQFMSVPPLESSHPVRDLCLCLHVQRAARRLARRFDDALRPFGLTSGQFSLMMALDRPAPPSMGALAALLAVDRTTLTAAVKPLRRRGLVTQTADAADRRSRLLTLTQAGQDLLADAVPVWEQTQSALDAALVEPDRLRRDLAALG